MGILRAVVEIAVLAVLHAGQDLLFRGAVAFQLVGDDHPRHVRQSLQQFGVHTTFVQKLSLTYYTHNWDLTHFWCRRHAGVPRMVTSLCLTHPMSRSTGVCRWLTATRRSRRALCAVTPGPRF